MFFQRHGLPFTITSDRGVREIRGFFAPISATDTELHSLTPAGIVGKDRFLLIMPASALAEDERLLSVSDGRFRYRVLRLDRYRLPNVGYQGHIETVLRREERLDA